MRIPAFAGMTRGEEMTFTQETLLFGQPLNKIQA